MRLRTSCSRGTARDHYWLGNGLECCTELHPRGWNWSLKLSLGQLLSVLLLDRAVVITLTLDTLFAFCLPDWGSVRFATIESDLNLP
jgi:hypothetical protein